MNVMESWAQALVANCMDVAKAWDTVYPDGPNSRIKSAKRRVAVFYDTVAANQGLWRRVAELQKLVDEKLALSAADVVRMWEVIATTDRRELSTVAKQECPACGGSGKDSEGDLCYRCNGDGHLGIVVQIPTSDTYSPGAVLVYEGAEMTKHGIKVHTIKRSEALMFLARHHGLLNDKLLLAKAGEPPALPPLPDDPNEAARLYADWVKQDV